MMNTVNDRQDMGQSIEQQKGHRLSKKIREQGTEKMQTDADALVCDDLHVFAATRLSCVSQQSGKPLPGHSPTGP